MSRIIPADFSQMSIERNKSGYTVLNPPFGSNYAIEVLATRPAAKYLPNYQEPLKKHNEHVFERKMSGARQREWSPEELSAQQLAKGKTTEQNVSQRLDELQTNMLARCIPGFWERLFKTEEYRQKIEARQIITNSFNFMKEAILKHDNAAVFLINPWKKDMELRLGSVGSSNTSNSFKQKLFGDIKQSINTDLKKDLQLEFEQSNQTDTYQSPPP